MADVVQQRIEVGARLTQTWLEIIPERVMNEIIINPNPRN